MESMELLYVYQNFAGNLWGIYLWDSNEKRYNFKGT